MAKLRTPGEPVRATAGNDTISIVPLLNGGDKNGKTGKYEGITLRINHGKSGTTTRKSFVLPNCSGLADGTLPEDVGSWLRVEVLPELLPPTTQMLETKKERLLSSVRAAWQDHIDKLVEKSKAKE